MADSRLLLLPMLLIGLSAHTNPPQELVDIDERVALITPADMLGDVALHPPVLTVAARTPIVIEILEDLGSKTSTSGDRFPLRLAEPIIVAGVEVMPAGTPGFGEIVHAKKSGGMGAAGELVLAARFLEFEGRTIRLRSLRIAQAGQSRENTVNAISAASAASGLPIGMIGFFLKGGQVNVASGTIADAMIAEEFVPEQSAPEEFAPIEFVPETGAGTINPEPSPTTEPSES